jgi:hypothetical protein
VIAPAAATDQETGIDPAVPATAARQADQETATGPVALATEIVPAVPAKAIAQAVPERAIDQADLATTTAPAVPATMAG